MLPTGGVADAVPQVRIDGVRVQEPEPL
jgi:hypothetical protein